MNRARSRRWWLTQKDGKWLIYDLEDLDAGMRLSSGILHLGVKGLDGDPAQSQAAEDLRIALRAMAKKNPDDFEAEKRLKKIEAVKLPRGLETARLVLWARVYLRIFKIPEAGKAMDAAHAHDPDWPMFDRLRAGTHLSQNQPAKAIEHLQAARKLLGDDAATCWLEGNAYQQLKKLPDAAEAYRKALDLDPDHADAYLDLLVSLRPGDRRDDLVPRFNKMKRKVDVFEAVVHQLKGDRDGQMLRQFAQIMVKDNPKRASAHFALAHADALDQKDAEALASFRAALKLENDEQNRRHATVDFMQMMAARAKDIGPLYDLLPDRQEAFRLLMDFLPDREELIKLHARHVPNDPVLLLYRGQMHLAEGDWQQADRDFSAAARQDVDPEMLKRFTRDRQQARFQMGKVLGAYKIDPSPQSFFNLANQCIFARKFAELETLLEVHDGADSESREIVTIRMRLNLSQQKYKEAVELFRKAFDRTRSFERQVVTRSFLQAMADADRALEGYRAVPDARLAFQILAQRSFDRQMDKELKELLEEHRKAHADDPRLELVAGRLLVMDKAWDKALPIFEKLWKDQAGKKAPPKDDDAPRDMSQEVRRLYLLCLARTGQALRAYKEVPPRRQVVFDLVYPLIEDKKLAEAEALLAAYKADEGETEEVVRLEIRIKILLKRPDEAIAAFQKAAKKGDDELRKDNLADFIFQMENAGHGLEAYRAAADPAWAFRVLADELFQRRKFEALATLLEEHAKKQPAADAWHLCYRGALSLERGKHDEAEKDLLAAKNMSASAKPEERPWVLNNLLLCLHVRTGKTVLAYEEAGKKRQSFETLSSICIREKNPAQLAALLAAHRLAHPDFAHWPAWELEVHWLAKDHAAALKVLEEHRHGVLKSDRHRHKLQYLVRCLVKVGRVKEAIAEAESQIRDKQSYVVPLVLATAAGNDVQQTIAVVEKYNHQRYLLESCYRDEDLGPILRGDAFRAFRERFPEPPLQKKPDPG